MRTTILKAGVLAALIAGGATGAPLTSSTGLAAPDILIDFESTGLAEGGAITTEIAGVEFTPVVALTAFGPAPAGALSGILGNYGANAEPIGILFDDDVTDVSFGFATEPDVSTTLTAFLSGVLVETFSLTTTSDDPAQAILGFTGILFDAITIETGDDIFLIDDIAYNLADDDGGDIGVVPLPAPFLLLATAFASAGLLGARRRA